MTNSVFERFTTPEEAGVSSKGLLQFLREAHKLRDTVQFHSMILLRHGKEVFRFNWAPYDDQTPHALFSLSKSFTSAAAGFAVSEGLLRWDSPVTEILPEEVPQGREDELKQVTLESLLCMGSGLAEESDSASRNPAITWARHVLSHAVKYPPMTHFHYNTFGTYLVSCMVQKVTGQTLVDYLEPRLFAPLGIDKPVWDMSPQGVCCGGFGLQLSCESIARFGQCLLQKGMWQGKQVLPEGWVELATREHIANYDGVRQDGNEWGQGYGFQFWRCIDGRYRGDGAFGQACIVDEKRDAVLAVTCASNDLVSELRLIREFLFPALDMEPGTGKDQLALAKKQSGLGYAFPYSDDGSVQALPEGEFGLPCFGTECIISMEMFHYDLIRLNMRFGEEAADRYEFFLPRNRIALVAANAYKRARFFGGYAWQKGKLMMTLRSVNSPDTMEGSLTWSKNRLVFRGLGIDIPGGRVVFQKK